MRTSATSRSYLFPLAGQLVQRPLDLSDLDLQVCGSFEYPTPNQLVVVERERRRVRGCRLYLDCRNKSSVDPEGISRRMDPPVEDEMLIWPQGGKDRGCRGYPRAG
jgi:CO dehydrogenase/acetyl-CoA synthase beta subunit